MMKSKGAATKKRWLCQEEGFVDVGWKYDHWKEKSTIKREISIKGCEKRAFMKHNWMYLAPYLH